MTRESLSPKDLIMRDITSLYGFGKIIAQDPPTRRPITPLDLMKYEAEMVAAAYDLSRALEVLAGRDGTIAREIKLMRDYGSQLDSGCGSPINQFLVEGEFWRKAFQIAVQLAHVVERTSDEFYPRKNLWLKKDADAWAEQFHMLFYVLHMTPEQIAQIDFGIDPEHPDARIAVFSWVHDITRIFPRVEVRPWTSSF
jgi:hypothetical protein